jgi:uncharacterized protein YfaT (DUF1175 family)
MIQQRVHSQQLTAEVSRDDRRILLRIRRNALEQALPVVHHQDSIGDVHYQFHVVLHHHDGDAIAACCEDAVEEAIYCRGEKPDLAQ